MLTTRPTRWSIIIVMIRMIIIIIIIIMIIIIRVYQPDEEVKDDSISSQCRYDVCL